MSSSRTMPKVKSAMCPPAFHQNAVRTGLLAARAIAVAVLSPGVCLGAVGVHLRCDASCIACLSCGFMSSNLSLVLRFAQREVAGRRLNL